MPPDPPVDPGAVDADALARRQFSTARRGYDPTEVREYLQEVAETVAALREAEDRARKRAAAAEERAARAEEPDQQQLLEMLGAETARVLDAARDAARDIRAKAEAAAERLIADANRQAHERVGEGEAEVLARRNEMMAEVEELRQQAAGELERRRHEGDEMVAEIRREAEAAAAVIRQEGEDERAKASAEAEQLREAARDEAKRLVTEAETIRARILGDLGRRRQAAREQLERLHGARGRLLAAYEVVRRTVDEATTELNLALPQARSASEAAARRVRRQPEPTLSELESEVSMARIAGLLPERPDTTELDLVLDPPDNENGDGVGDLPAGEEVVIGVTLPDTPARAGEQDRDGHGGIDAGIEGEGGDPAGADGAGGGGGRGEGGPVGDQLFDVDQASWDAALLAGADLGLAVGIEAEAMDMAAMADLLAEVNAAAARPAEPDGTGELDVAAESAEELDRVGEAAIDAADESVGIGSGTGGDDVDGELFPDPWGTGLDGESAGGVAGSDDAGGMDSLGGLPADAVPGTDLPLTFTHDWSFPAHELGDPAPTAGGVHLEDLPPADAQRDASDPAVVVDAVDPEDPAPGRDGAEAATVTGTAPDPPEGSESPEPSEGRETTAEEPPTTVNGVDAVDAVFARLRGSVAGPPSNGALLRQRDETLEPLERSLGRRLKRVLADEQNEVLDRLRRSKDPAQDEILPPENTHIDRYADAAADELHTAAYWGAAAVEGEPASSCEDLIAELGGHLATPLREKVLAAVDDIGVADDAAAEELTNRLRALYRDWKGRRVAETVRHYVAAAYARGAYAATSEDAQVRWVADPCDGACPDADENALAGSRDKGVTFPTGHCLPPAHAGCRCLVMPVAAEVMVEPVAGDWSG